MRKNAAFVVWVIVAALSGALLVAQDETRADVLFQTALAKETLQGDLAGAIDLDEKAVGAARGDRSLAARALLRLGEAHRKLGQDKARDVFERLVREFSDQKEAVAEARTRLASLGTGSAPTAGIVTRQVWTGPAVDILGGVSTDGRYVSFVDWTTGDLALHDLVHGTDRRLTNKGTWADSDDFAEESIMSPDGKQVGYSWFNKEFRYDLRVIDVNTGASAKPRVLYDNEDVEWIGPFDWSADGKWIAVQLSRKDRTAQIGLVSTADGSLRVLKSVDWRSSSKLAFSPDSQYLAFDLPHNEESEQRDVFVMAIDGSRQNPVVIHPADDRALGWTPDGSHLLFATDRTGSRDVWALPVQQGRAEGVPVFVKSNIGLPLAMGMARSGSLYFGVNTSGPSVHVAAFDVEAGTLAPPAQPLQLVGPNRQPDWSPDGKYLAYASRRFNRFNILVIRSVETGELRELRPRLTYLQFPRWAPDGRSVAVQGTDPKGRQGLYRIDVRTAEVSEMVPKASNILWSPEGERIFFHKFDEARKEDTLIIERHLASGRDREILRAQNLSGLSLSLSPDGRHLAFRTIDRAAKDGVLVVVTIANGQQRELLRVKGPEELGNFTTWTPDGRSIVTTRNPSSQTDLDSQLWIVPVDGAKPKAVKSSFRQARGLRFQPGGNQVAFFTPASTPPEVWVMENFLPVLSGKR